MAYCFHQETLLLFQMPVLIIHEVGAPLDEPAAPWTTFPTPSTQEIDGHMHHSIWLLSDTSASGFISVPSPRARSSADLSPGQPHLPNAT